MGRKNPAGRQDSPEAASGHLRTSEKIYGTDCTHLRAPRTRDIHVRKGPISIRGSHQNPGRPPFLTLSDRRSGRAVRAELAWCELSRPRTAVPYRIGNGVLKPYVLELYQPAGLARVTRPGDRHCYAGLYPELVELLWRTLCPVQYFLS